MCYLTWKRFCLLLCTALICAGLTGCGFHLQGQAQLPPQLHRLYFKTSDPYGYLSRTLKESFKLSNVILVNSPDEAQTVFEILSDTTTQNFVTVGGSQQTRQYNLIVNVVYQVTDPKGRVLLGPETLSETRSLVLQSNQVLGASNEATSYYQQMRRSIAYSIMNRLASQQVGTAIRVGLMPPPVPNSMGPIQ